MKTLSAVLAALLVSTAFAQSRGGSTGPFTGYEADVLSDVWPEIRQAADFEDINWRAHGLDRAPGSREAQRWWRRIGMRRGGRNVSAISTGTR